MSWNPAAIIQPFPNLYPFNGDFEFSDKLIELIKRYDLKWVIETGTSNGNSTRQLATMFSQVYTIELNRAQYEVTTPFLKQFPNTTAYCGHSGKMLSQLLQDLKLTGNGAFYLDAHWYNDWPLLDELKAISNSNVKGHSLIIIDDMDIPGIVEGDKYGNRVLNLEYVKEDLLKTGVVNYEYHIPKLPQFRGKLVAKPWLD